MMDWPFGILAVSSIIVESIVCHYFLVEVPEADEKARLRLRLSVVIVNILTAYFVASVAIAKSPWVLHLSSAELCVAIFEIVILFAVNRKILGLFRAFRLSIFANAASYALWLALLPLIASS